MICTLTGRRLKPGTYEQFRDTFEAANNAVPEEIVKRWKKVYVCRDVTDENVVLSFGFFDGTLEELREIQSGAASSRDAELGSIAPFVEEVLLDGSYEVAEEITP
jgi:hypothetical protein